MKTSGRNSWLRRLGYGICCLFLMTAVSGITNPCQALQADLNDDGLINLSDVILGIQVVAGMTPVTLPADWLQTGSDVNGDGRIGLADVFYALRSIAGEPGELSIDEMAHVVDVSGEPVFNARMGGGELTDMNGIATGRFEVSPSGWVSVSAAGYVTGYTAAPETLYPFLYPSTLSGVQFYRIELTPYGDVALLNQGEPQQRLCLGPPDAPVYETNLDPAIFVKTPVAVSLTEIDPVHIQPLFENLSSGADLQLQMAFSVGAEGIDGSRVPLVTGGEIVVQIKDGGRLSAAPVLAFFSKDEGNWQVVEGGCTRSGPSHLQCRISSPSSLYALFDAETSTGTLKRRSGRLARTQDDYAAARREMASILDDWRDRMADDPSYEPDLNDPALQGALEDLANAARNIASGNQNEKGKSALLGAAAQAQLLGNDSLSSDLIGEAADIAAKMADELLAEGDCGRLREMLHVAQQNMLLGNDAKANDLLEKAKKNASECDIWAGTIRYWLIVDNTVHGLETMTRQSGPGGWWEFHDVRITTDVMTRTLTGEDKVRLQFQKVKYEDKEEPCEQSIAYGPPTGDSVYLSFGGTYDGLTFSVDNPGPAPNPVSIPMQQMFESDDGEGGCVSIANQTTYLPNFSSILVHGFALDTPPITLQDMLTSGIHQMAAEGIMETIRGQTEIVHPNPELARLPVTRGHVFWSFMHVEDMLPLENR